MCAEFKQGLTYQVIQNDMQELKLATIVEVINKLLATVSISHTHPMLAVELEDYQFLQTNPGNDKMTAVF